MCVPVILSSILIGIGRARSCVYVPSIVIRHADVFERKFARLFYVHLAHTQTHTNAYTAHGGRVEMKPKIV